MSKKSADNKTSSEEISKELKSNIEAYVSSMIQYEILLKIGTIQVISEELSKGFTKTNEHFSKFIISSSVDDDSSREEKIRLAQERIRKLKELTQKMKSPEGLAALEKSTLEHKKIFGSFAEATDDSQIKIQELSIKIDKIKSELDKFREENENIKRSFIDFVSNSRFENAPKIQFVETEIYIDSSDPMAIMDVYTYVKKALVNLELIPDIELPAKLGSWYKKLIAKTKSAVTSDELTSRLKEIEYGLEVNGVLKQQSEIDKNQSEALLNILKGIENTPNAVIRIGSILVVKTTSPVTGVPSIQVRTLTISELHFINKNPHLTSAPAELLIALSKNNDEGTDKFLN